MALDVVSAQIDCAILEAVEKSANATSAALERVLSLMERIEWAAARLPQMDDAEKRGAK